VVVAAFVCIQVPHVWSRHVVLTLLLKSECGSAASRSHNPHLAVIALVGASDSGVVEAGFVCIQEPHVDPLLDSECVTSEISETPTLAVIALGCASDSGVVVAAFVCIQVPHADLLLDSVTCFGSWGIGWCLGWCLGW